MKDRANLSPEYKGVWIIPIALPYLWILSRLSTSIEPAMTSLIGLNCPLIIIKTLFISISCVFSSSDNSELKIIVSANCSWVTPNTFCKNASPKCENGGLPTSCAIPAVNNSFEYRVNSGFSPTILARCATPILCSKREGICIPSVIGGTADNEISLNLWIWGVSIILCSSCENIISPYNVSFCKNNGLSGVILESITL